MRINRTIAALTLAAFAAGCSTVPQYANADYSLVDPAQVYDTEKYQDHYAGCARLANQSNVASNAVAGAIVGALLTAAIGAALFGRSGARYGARIGAVDGAIAGATTSVVDQQTTLRNCLAGWGYTVIR
jgi:outer membrane lipoprotein SlyB